MNGKKADFNFVLIFAILAGSAILIIAIYGAMKFGSGVRGESEAELAKSFDIITNSLQAGFAEGATHVIGYGKPSRINNRCDSYSEFGNNVISFQTQSSVGEKWSENPIEYSIYNKYIFSNTKESEEFYVYSKSFYTGYKVADLIFVYTDAYCFVNPPENIKQEILGLGIEKMGIKSSENNTCKEDSTQICFDANGCEITVYGECKDSGCETEYDFGFILDSKNEKKYFSGNLLIGAIISDKEDYDCNVKRLLYRSSRIAEIFSRKIDITSSRICGDVLRDDLNTFSSILQNATSRDLESIYRTSNNLIVKNRNLGECKIW